MLCSLSVVGKGCRLGHIARDLRSQAVKQNCRTDSVDLIKKLQLGIGLGVSAAVVSCPVAAAEILIRTEPANALSLPTWIIHISSVLEWSVHLLQPLHQNVIYL